jgi:anti-sigma factor RsiW
MVNDLDIQALADNELSAEDEKRVRKMMDSNNRARRRYEEIKWQKQLLLYWFEITHLAH